MDSGSGGLRPPATILQPFRAAQTGPGNQLFRSLWLCRCRLLWLGWFRGGKGDGRYLYQDHGKVFSVALGRGGARTPRRSACVDVEVVLSTDARATPFVA